MPRAARERQGVGLFLSLALFCFASLHGQNSAPPSVVPAREGVTRASVVWRAGPWPGTKIAVLERSGNDRDGSRTIWMLLPDGFWIMPHRHPSAKRINVISGTLLLGTGESFRAAETPALPAGGFALMPAGEPHYEGARGETIVQFSAVGPWTTVFVDPAEEYRIVPR